MRRVGPHSYTEIYFAGCNPGFVETSDGYVMIDSPQQPIDAVRWREMLEEKAPIRYLINTEPHGDHIAGNAFFTKTTVVGQVQLQECFERYLAAFGTSRRSANASSRPTRTVSFCSAIPITRSRGRRP